MTHIVNIPVPRHGVVQGATDSSRPLTAVHTVENMLLRNVEDGRIQLASRPGLERVWDTEFGGEMEPISAVYPVDYANPAEEYREFLEGEIEAIWAKDGKAVWVVSDLDGGVYFLLENGEVHYRAQSGDSVFQFAVPILQGQMLVPTIVLDPAGSIYAATSSGIGGGLSRLYKFSPRADDEGLDQVFAFAVAAKEIADIETYGGQVFVAVNEAERRSWIVALEGAGNDSPVEAYRVSTPYPLRSVRFGTGLIFDCPPDPERGSGGLIGGDGQLWSIADLPAAAQRVHAVYDARYAGDQPDGGLVALMPDVRGLIGVAPLDQTDRTLTAAYWWNPALAYGSPAPFFRTQLDDGDPAVKFDYGVGSPVVAGAVEYDQGTSLWSQLADIPGENWRVDKPTTSAGLPRSGGIFPHVVTHEFVCAWRIRWAKNSGPQLVWSVGGYAGHGKLPPADTACLALVVQDAGGAAITAAAGDGKVTLRGCLAGGFKTLSATEINGQWEAIVVLHRKNGANSVLRVNGVASTAFNLNDGLIANPIETWGHRIFREDRPLGTSTVYDPTVGGYIQVPNPPSAADLWFLGCDSFNGSLRAAWSALSPTTTTPHDTAFPTGEIQLIEGALSWRRGNGDLLAVGHPYKSTPPLRSVPGVVVTEGDTARALRSPLGIVGRLAAGTDAIQWAEAGPGIGYALAARQDGWIYTAGPRATDPSLPLDAGPYSVVLRRMRDRGASAEMVRPLRGEVILYGIPDVDDEVKIPIGDGTTVTFAYGGTGVPSPTYVVVAIAGTAVGCITLLQQAVTLSEFYAAEKAPLGNDAYSLTVLSRFTGGVESPITVTSPGGHLEVVSGMSGASSPEGAWEVRADYDSGLVSSEGFGISTDIDGDVYVPWHGPVAANEIRRYERETGVQRWGQAIGSPGTTWKAVYADQRDIPWGDGIEGPEFLYLAGDAAQGQVKARLIERTPSLRPPHERMTLVVKGGLPFALTQAGVATALPVDNPFGGPTADFQVAEFQGVVLVSDGTSQYEWNPRLGTWKPWESRRGAQIPSGSRLMAAWNGRVIVADGSDPYQWVASAVGDYTDFDLSPKIPTATQAVSSVIAEGNTSSNDVLTAIIPIGDDLLLLGGLSSISRLTGDPMAGGQLDAVSHQLGIAFGSAWCHMPDGGVTFFSHPVGVWRISAGGTNLTELSKDLIEGDLESIDTTKYRIRMAYSRALRGVMIVPVPLDMDMEFDGRWWLLDDNGSWWPMRWADRKVQPTSVAQVRDLGEPTFGCWDGQVRSMTAGAADGGYEFQWNWVVGPFWDRQWNKMQRFSRPFVRFSADGPIQWLGYASTGPLQIGQPDAMGVLYPGEPRPAGMKLKGKAFWLEIRGAGVSAAIEHATFNMHEAGRTK